MVCVFCFFADSCLAGKLDNIGTLTCDDCKIGSYQNGDNQLFCHPCPKGFYQNLKGATFCYPCGFGYYQNETNKDFCYQCPEKMSTFTKDAANVSQCKCMHFCLHLIFLLGSAAMQIVLQFKTKFFSVFFSSVFCGISQNFRN